jgi:hypothetical protein
MVPADLPLMIGPGPSTPTPLPQVVPLALPAPVPTREQAPATTVPAWRRAIVASEFEVAIREDLLLAPDYRGRQRGELPEKIGVCEFATAGRRCTKPGRWHRHGSLACRMHAAARSPRRWEAAAA